MVLYIHSSPFRLQGILLLINQSICIAIRAERPGKTIFNQQINSSYIHEQAHNKNTLSSHPNLPKKKPSLTNIHTHISAHAQSMSHSTPPLSSTPSSSGTCKYDTHVAQDSTVYENSTTTSSSSFYEDDDEEDEEEEPFIILQATAMKITSFPPTAAAVTKISVKGKGSSIATTTSQKVGGRAPAVASRPPAFLATPGDALPVFSSERAKRAARSVR